MRISAVLAGEPARARRGRARRLVLGLLIPLLGVPVLLAAPLRVFDPPMSALMLWRRAQGTAIDMRRRGLAELPDVLPMAVIASEDYEFCHERLGVDIDSMAAQLGVWMRGGRPGGAGTIAMQLARNLYLWPERGVVRKALEIWLATGIALAVPQRRQLELYLNIAEFGPGVFGVEAGARHWFGIGADALTPDQAARLIAILPAPLLLSPLAPGPAAAGRAAVIRRMVVTGDQRLSCAGGGPVAWPGDAA